MSADPTCRRCGVDLDQWNARRARGRWVGACRSCETVESMGRAARRRATVAPNHRRAGRCQEHDDLAWLYDDGSIECMYVRSVDFAEGACEWGAMSKSWRHAGQPYGVATNV